MSCHHRILSDYPVKSRQASQAQLFTGAALLDIEGPADLASWLAANT